MEVRFQRFESMMKSWDDLARDATDLATDLGPERVFEISHSADQGTGVIVVWYWSQPPPNTDLSTDLKDLKQRVAQFERRLTQSQAQPETANASTGTIRVCCKRFESMMKSWDKLLGEAIDYINALNPERFISISHSSDQGTGVIMVWYWGKPETCFKCGYDLRGSTDRCPECGQPIVDDA